MYSKTTSNLYLRLLCRFEPKGVLSFLKGNDSYDIDECLEYCSSHAIHTASAYLLERKGDLKGAFAGYIREICRINEQLSGKGFGEISWLHKANEACTLAISLCTRSYEGRRGCMFRDKDQIIGSLWYQLALTYIEAYQNAKGGVSQKNREALLGYIATVVSSAAPYLDPQVMAIYIIESFQDARWGELREVVQVLMQVSHFDLQTSKLTQNISSQECLESISSSYSSLTRSEKYR